MEKLVELVRGGSVINGAYPVQFLIVLTTLANLRFLWHIFAFDVIPFYYAYFCKPCICRHKLAHLKHNLANLNTLTRFDILRLFYRAVSWCWIIELDTWLAHRLCDFPTGVRPTTQQLCDFFPAILNY